MKGERNRKARQGEARQGEARRAQRRDGASVGQVRGKHKARLGEP